MIKTTGENTDYFTIARDSAAVWACPRPGWSGPATLFGAPLVGIDRVPVNCALVAAGVPFDSTASSRPGAAEGPEAIRRATLAYSSYLESLGDHEMLDLRSGRSYRLRPLGSIADAGDLHIFPSSTERTFAAVASETRELKQRCQQLLIMGGDHSITFGSFAGVAAALTAAKPEARLGYVQIDHHFDFGRPSDLHGEIHHGSQARLISELPCIDAHNMCFVGQGYSTRRDQYEGMRLAGIGLLPARRLIEGSVTQPLAALTEEHLADCDAVYISLDIDVLDSCWAPGTGHTTIGGISAGHLLDVCEYLMRALPVVALDVVEVAPRYDPTGRTAQLVSQLLFNLFMREPVQ